MTATMGRHRCRERRMLVRNGFRSFGVTRWVLAGSGWITLLCMYLLPPGLPLRTAVVFGFVLLCPGLAIAGLVPMLDPLERWVAGVALSIASGLLVSLGFTLLRTGAVTVRIGTLALLTTSVVLAAPAVSQFRGARAVRRDRKVGP